MTAARAIQPIGTNLSDDRLECLRHSGRSAPRYCSMLKTKWPTRKRELPAHTKEGLALVTTVKRFEQMLRNVRVTFLTDSANTVDLLTNTDWDLVPSLLRATAGMNVRTASSTLLCES